MEVMLVVLSVLVIVAIVLIVVFRPRATRGEGHLAERMDRLQAAIRDDFRGNREEHSRLAKDNREELNNTLRSFKAEMSEALKSITELNRKAMDLVNRTLDEKLNALASRIDENNKANRDELSRNLKDFAFASKEDNTRMRELLVSTFTEFRESINKNAESFNALQREKFSLLDERQLKMVESTEKKLEEMRTTVDEKLQKTLNERLGQSFELVGKQLESVQKGLGEMQTIASDVGGLKKVLSNVKLRGGIGEVQLGMLLEQVLVPAQYESNVRTKKGSSEPVEYAIKLPGRSEDESSFVYLPIDAKFPKDAYEHLINAYENAVPDDIEAATKNMEMTIRRMAKDIRDKYLDPPHTTDFAIMFLPFESIYAEVIRRSALVDQLRDEYKISVAGPTTLVAILNSLQMGFRTLALQKRSSEVWQVLATVKNEFEKFGGMLEKAQKNIQTGLGQLDDVMGTRTRAIRRQLKNVGDLPGNNQPGLPDMNVGDTSSDE